MIRTLTLLAILAAPAWSQDGGLQSRWTCDEGSGMVAADSGPSMNNGQLFQVATGWTDDVPSIFPAGSHALSFTGGAVWPATGAYPAYGGNFTMTVWAKPTKTRAARAESATVATDPRDQQFAIAPYDATQIYGAGHTGLGLSVGTDGVTVMDVDSTFRTLLNYDVAVSGWTHFAVVVQGNRPSLYVNGVFARQGVVPVTTLHASGDLGAERESGWGNFFGLVDDVRIYDRVLAPAELLSMTTVPAANPQPTIPVLVGVNESGDGSGGCGGSATGRATLAIAVIAFAIVRLR